MIELYIGKNSNFNYFISYFIITMKALNHDYNIIKIDKFNNKDINQVIVIVNNKKKYIVDTRDRITQIEWHLLDQINIYYKCQLPMHVSIQDIPLKMKRDYNRILKDKLSYKIKPLCMFRNIRFPLPSKININFNIIDYFNQFRADKKDKIIVSYSRGHHSIGRIKLYNFLENNFNDEFYIISNNKNSTFNYIRNLQGMNYPEYINFISSGYFMLNLSGHSGSNPFRCIDAILSKTAVITDFIYSDAFADFPAYHIDCNVQMHILNEKKILEQLNLLLDDYKKISEKLIIDQEKWFNNKFNYQNYFNYIFQ